MLATKSIREPKSDADGLRLLVTRYRGRGVPKEACDVWMPNLGPSERLLKRVLSGAISWRDFTGAYRREMLGEGAVETGNPKSRNAGQRYTLRLLRRLASRGPVTLLCHCAADATACHRFVLKALVEKA